MGRKVELKKKENLSMDNFNRYNPNLNTVARESPKFSFPQSSKHSKENRFASTSQEFYQNVESKSSGYHYSMGTSKRFAELKKVLAELKHQPSLKVFLISFFLFSVGVQTIILMAGIFGSKELKLETSSLILAILLVQFVAIAGAAIFSRVSKKYGNITALKITIIIWGVVCLTAFIVDKEQENSQYYFYGLGGLIGLVLGAIQSLARSTYSKMLPETDDHATYFSFYDVTFNVSIVVGTIAYGTIEYITGSMRFSALGLGVLFIIGLFLLRSVQVRKT